MKWEQLFYVKTVKENDVGVTVYANMKVSVQCRIAASMGKIIGMSRSNTP